MKVIKKPVKKSRIKRFDFVKKAHYFGPMKYVAYFVAKMKLRDAIKADLLDQLDRAGKVGEHNKDLVNDYMTMWDAKNGLAEDMEKNGVVRTRGCRFSAPERLDIRRKFSIFVLENRAGDADSGARRPDMPC